MAEISSWEHWKKDENGQWVIPERMQAYLQWLITPPEDREPSTKKALLKEYGVSYQTLRNWEKNPFFREQWDKALAEMNISPDRTQEVIDAMHKNAVSGDTKAMELYLRMVEKISPPKVIIEEKGVEQMSDEELAAALGERQARLRVVK